MDVGTNVWVRYVAVQKDYKTPAKNVKSATSSSNSKYRSSSSSASSSSSDTIDPSKINDFNQLFSIKTVSWLGATIRYKKIDSNGVVSVTANLVEPYSLISSKREFTFQFPLNECDKQEDLKYRIADDATVPENLNNLPFLNEPEILNCLRKRYWTDNIYTYAGSILIALNPFKQIHGLYSDTLLASFVDFTAASSPHIWNIARSAYTSLLNDLDTGSDSGAVLSYSVLISGESGSGKSESCKYLLKHLTKVGIGDSLFPHEPQERMVSIMNQIMYSNPVLEAFGNSKTLRNSNSSRFGKYINLNFDGDAILIGGSIQTYLLENVRVVNQQLHEDNFHIFLYLFGGGNEVERNRWELGCCDSFNYLNRVQLPVVNDSDTAKFKDLKESLTRLNFDSDVIDLVFDIAAGVLHVGQIKFDSNLDAGCEIARVVNHLALHRVARLCGLATYELEDALTARTVSSRGEKIRKPLSKLQAINARDAVAKTVYKRLFDWLVAAINGNMTSNSNSVIANIGILDIFGFECFAKNSFEQLCINYANEELQKHFNNNVFEMELIEYKKEGIALNITFDNNQESLDLIGVHIFKILDDQCKLPNPTDERFASQLYKDLSAKPSFVASKKEQRDLHFTINHFAGPVQYTSERFVEKNIDELPSDILMMLQHSLNSILSSSPSEPCSSNTSYQTPAKRHSVVSVNTPARKSNHPSVSHQFKHQLNDLMARLTSTTPFYVRCIKPRDIEISQKLKSRNENTQENIIRFNESRVSEQLHNGGVFMAVKVSRARYAIRLFFYDFFFRYRFIMNAYDGEKLPFIARAKVSRSHCEQLCKYLLTTIRREVVCKEEYESIQVGQTKVFLHQNYFNVLEKIKSRIILRSALKLQYFCRKNLSGYFIQRKYSKVQKQTAASLLQSITRMWVERRRYLRYVSVVRLLQQRFHFRKSIKRNRGVVVIVKFFRTIYTRAIIHRCLKSLIAKSPQPDVPDIVTDTNLIEISRSNSISTFSHITTSDLYNVEITDVGDAKMRFSKSTESSPSLESVNNVSAFDDQLSIAEIMNQPNTVDCSEQERSGPQSQEKFTPCSSPVTPLEPIIINDSTDNEHDDDVVVHTVRKGALELDATFVEISNCRHQCQLTVLDEFRVFLESVPKIAAFQSILAIDILHVKYLLLESLKLIPKGKMGASLQRVNTLVDYGYTLLSHESLITSSPLTRIFNYFKKDKPEKWTFPARFPQKTVNADHKMFQPIYEVMQCLNVLKTNAEECLTSIPHKKNALQIEYDRCERRFGLSYRKSYFEKLQCELKELKVTEGVVSSIVEVTDVLVSYYLEYISKTVIEYGSNSSYRANFKSETDYLFDLARIVSLRQRFLRGEVLKLTPVPDQELPGSSAPAVLSREPAKTNILIIQQAISEGIQIADGSFEIDLFRQTFTPGSIKCAKYHPFAPGLEFSFNFLLRIFSDTVDTKSAGKITGVHVIRIQNDTSLTTEYTHKLLQQSRWLKNKSEMIVKIVGMDGHSNSSTKSILYQLSPVFSAETLNNVLSNSNLIKAINRQSYSSMTVACLLFGILNLKPENIIVQSGKRKNTNTATVSLEGFNVDEELTASLFGCYNNDSLFGINVLFFLPQADEAVDKETVYFFTRSTNIAEKIILLWLREIRSQNLKSKMLEKSSGLNAADCEQMNLPIRFPSGMAVVLYERLRTICKMLRSQAHCTHRKLLHVLYPSLVPFYKRDYCGAIGGANQRGTKLTVSETYHAALNALHSENKKSPVKVKASLSAVFNFDEIFPFDSTSRTYDRETVISELNMEKGSLTNGRTDSFTVKSASLDREKNTKAANYSSTSTKSSSLDLMGIYNSFVSQHRSESKNALALMPLHSVVNELQPPSSMSSERYFSTSKKKALVSFDLGEKSQRDSTLKSFADSPEVDMRMNNRTNMPEHLSANSFDFGDIYKRVDSPRRDTLVMEPYVTTALVKFSKAFEMERRSAKLNKKYISINGGTADTAERDRERLKEFFYDPKVEFGEIYSEEEMFEMTAPSIQPKDDSLPARNESTSIGTSSQHTDKDSSAGVDDIQVDIEEKVDPFKGFCSIEEVSLEFLTHLDFSELHSSDGQSVCKLIGQELTFLEIICLYKINEQQLSAIFGSWMSTESTQSPRKTKSSAEKRLRLTDMNTEPKKLRTKSIFILGLDRKLKHTIKCSKVYFDIQGKLGIKIKFISRN